MKAEYKESLARLNSEIRKMRLFSTFLGFSGFAAQKDFVVVKRLAEVKGIKCPLTADDNTFGDTRDAVVEAFNLSKTPVKDSRWRADDCDNGEELGSIHILYRSKEKNINGFYWQMEQDLGIPETDSLTLKYDVKFEKDFDWVKGGKLPGLFGGAVSCSGGADAAELGCFSTRLMWRAEGDAELYLYAPQPAESAGSSRWILRSQRRRK